MLEKGFNLEWNDYDSYIAELVRLGIKPGDRVFDFGCSWGDGSYQLRAAGYDVLSYDIAVDRRSFGEDRLGVTLVENPDEIVEGHALFNSFDCFFSAHVLEHVPVPSKIINLAWRCLKPGGIFVAFFPNGNAAYRRNAPKSWRNMWGDVHPNFLDDQFFKAHFKSQVPEFFARAGQDKDNYYELGVVVKK